MKILITGGAGFVGSHLADKLIEQGHEITVIDDLSTGRYSNIEHLEGNKNFRLIIDTVLNESLMEELIRETDRVYHMASAVGVRLIMEQPVKTIETIFHGTDVILKFCSRYRKRVLIPSTSEVYGKGATVPFSEDDDLLTGATDKHRWAYACAKTLDEFLALAHWKETRLAVVVVRLFNTVGPRQTGQYGMVVPRFVQAAMKNEPITVFGDGTQARCFGHVHDVVEGLVKLLDSPECFGQVINLGNSEEVSINGLAEKAIALTGSSSEIRYVSYDEAYGEGFEDMRRRVPNLEKAGRLIGYKPTRTLDNIINDVANELKKESSAAKAMLKYLKFPAILVGLILLASSVFAQSGGIKGKIRDQRGKGIPGAQVEVRKDGNVIKSASSNAKGEFQIIGLKQGVYNVSFDADGYATGVLHGVEVKNGTRDLGGRLVLSVDQGTQVIIRGSVFYKEGTSVTGAKVDLELVNADGTTKKLGSAYTTISGDFTFRRPGGVAKLRVTAKFKGAAASKDIDVDNAAIYRTAITLDISRQEK